MRPIILLTPFKRNRTPSKHIYYALRLYISDLSLRKKDIAEVISICQEESYFDMEFDSIMVQAKEDTTEEKKRRVRNR
jgi:hypothetical protein